MKSGLLIREARLRAGLTQQELAARAGTTQSSVARWEAGDVRPSADTLAALVAACGLELRMMLVDVDPAEASRLEGTLTLTPEERLDQLVRTVSFIQAGRRAVAERLG